MEAVDPFVRRNAFEIEARVPRQPDPQRRLRVNAVEIRQQLTTLLRRAGGAERAVHLPAVFGVQAEREANARSTAA